MLAKGTRVQLHPATDLWMQGDRYGEIVGYGRAREYRNQFTGETTKVKPYRIKLDISRKFTSQHPDNVIPVE